MNPEVSGQVKIKKTGFFTELLAAHFFKIEALSQKLLR
jgi:hypothetical protein